MAAEAGLEVLSPRGLAPEKDFLRRFGTERCKDEAADENSGLAAADEVDLGLGLSLGGRFGVENRLLRASSIATPSVTVAGGDDDLVMAVGVPIARASSLPTETEEEQRKRKGMQSLKRMEAKRRRLEKKDSRSRGKEEDSGEGLGGRRNGACGELPGSVGRRPADAVSVLGLVSHGSVGSQGSGSSGVSDIESRREQGLGITVLSISKEASSHKVTTPLPLSQAKHRARTPAVRGSSCEEDEPSSKKIAAATNGLKEQTVRRNVMEEMPCVSTCGDGPNGKRIQGFLYNYGRVGEEVRIVCVCHGSFLTPAEFVKHAGGGDVAHPLRHIVVSTSASALL